jgi:hypothetical protein
MRRKKILFFILAIIFMVANPAMGQSQDCSQKYLVNERPPIGSGSNYYRRRVVFPWYAVGPNPDGSRWETRLSLGLAALPAPNGFLGGNFFLQYKTMREKPPWAVSNPWVVSGVLKDTSLDSLPHFSGWGGDFSGTFQV